MYDLKASGQGSNEPDASWFDLFSKRYLKGILLDCIRFDFFWLYILHHIMIKCFLIVILNPSIASIKRSH
jgi:hypothetical protein